MLRYLYNKWIYLHSKLNIILFTGSIFLKRKVHANINDIWSIGYTRQWHCGNQMLTLNMSWLTLPGFMDKLKWSAITYSHLLVIYYIIFKIKMLRPFPYFAHKKAQIIFVNCGIWDHPYIMSSPLVVQLPPPLSYWNWPV